VRGKGVLLGVEIVQDPVTNKPFPKENSFGDVFYKTAIQNGIILRISEDWFAMAPPLIATDAQLEEMGDLIEKSVRQALDLIAAKH
jgi:adenosylmethionine-8-amino-7-oxononanoate aminotransferase